MKTLFAVALCAMLALTLCPLALAESLPLTAADIEPITSLLHKTMAEYVEAFQPSFYNWYESESAEDVTLYMLIVEGGSFTLGTPGAPDFSAAEQVDERSVACAIVLQEDALQKQVWLEGVSWEDEGFPLALPRGLKLGDTKRQLLDAVGGFGEVDPEAAPPQERL